MHVAVVVIVVFVLVLAVFRLVVMTMHGVAVEVDSSVEIAVGAVDEDEELTILEVVDMWNNA